MIIVSDILNAWYRSKLKSASYRKTVFQQALNKELRHSRSGRALLRNINELMTNNPGWHDEFKAVIGNKNYQEAFWESDLGYLWYQGNLNQQNEYFNAVEQAIREHGHQSHLDVGCGWGELTNRVAGLEGMQQAVGIDIAADVIEKAKSLQSNPNAQFECRDVLDETRQFDLVTILGSTDYIPPAIWDDVLRKMLQLARKQVIIVNSLRGVPFEEALQLTESKETYRYDIGCVQPINQCLKAWQGEFGYTFEVRKAGLDSTITSILLP